jgi:DNA repair protein RecO (recombination protein O)
MTVFKSQIQRIDSELGYILHSRPYRETSVILDVFTKQYGRIHLVGRGLRKSPAKKHRLPELFTQYEFAWVSGYSELYTLTGMEVAGNGAYLFSSYQLCCCLYLNELLLRVLQREDAHLDLFLAYQTALYNIYHDVDNPTEFHLRVFEKKLLQSLGYGICFDHINIEEHYVFQSAKGFVPVPHETKESISGHSLKAFANDTVLAKDRQVIKRIMRHALIPLIGDKPLKTKELFR